MIQPQDAGRFYDVNGARLYTEVRGSGPAVVFVSPATGDCGLFTQVATALADEFTCVTFDRRGNSRSPKPAGWTRTTLAEQADDVVGVLQATLGRPAVVFGSSGGGTVAVEVLVRYPEWVTALILHEPALPSVLTPEERRRAPQLDDRIERAMREGGPRAAMEARLRLVIGNDVWEGLAEPMRDRLLGNAETLFFIETDPWGRYRPDEAALRRAHQRTLVLTSVGSPPLNLTIRDWLLERIPGATAGTLPGRHVPYLDSPDETAAVLRGQLRELTSGS